MTHELSVYQLRSSHYLFQEKERQLKNRIGGLQLDEIKNEDALNHTTKRIKDDLLLVPVSFGDPKIVGHETELRKLDFTQQVMGVPAEVCHVTVAFPFTGSVELFQYCPSNTKFGASNTRVCQPDGNHVLVTVTIPKLDKELAINEARKRMELTFSIIDGHKNEIEHWSKKIAAQIDENIKKRRKEILALYS